MKELLLDILNDVACGIINVSDVRAVFSESKPRSENDVNQRLSTAKDHLVPFFLYTLRENAQRFISLRDASLVPNWESATESQAKHNIKEHASVPKQVQNKNIDNHYRRSPDSRNKSRSNEVNQGEESYISKTPNKCNGNIRDATVSWPSPSESMVNTPNIKSKNVRKKASLSPCTPDNGRDFSRNQKHYQNKRVQDITLDSFLPSPAVKEEAKYRKKQSIHRLDGRNNTNPRRINPTMVTSRSNKFTSGNLFITSEASSVGTLPVEKSVNSCFAEAVEMDRKEFVDERKLIKDQKLCLKMEVSPAIVETSARTSSTPTTLLDFKDVTDSQKLRVLASLYALFIRDGLIPNFTVEVHFLFQLLNSKEVNESSCLPDTRNIFPLNSMADCVYFSVSVIEELSCLLKYLDQSTLKLLCENVRFKCFSSRTTFDGLVVAHRQTPKVAVNSIKSVMFQSDTDNRNNFPSEKSFQSFKKQRDLFYQVLKLWEDNCHNPKWSLTGNMRVKIENIVNLCVDSGNYAHLARLFQAQLISMCSKPSVDAGQCSDDLAFFEAVTGCSTEKLKRLEQRIISPREQSPCPVPCFPGYQEFFRDFIIAASNYAFNEHLKGVLETRILEMNCLNDLDLDEENEEDLSLIILPYINTLRILAKFFGFLTFLPYESHFPKSPTPDSPAVVQLLEIRKRWELPSLLEKMVVKSISNGCMIITVPWIVEFLNMMDPLAPFIPTMKSLLDTLLSVYRGICSNAFERKLNVSESCSFYLRIALGWLFAHANLPSSIFHYTHKGINSEHCFTEGERSVSILMLDSQTSLDASLVEESFIFLRELRSVLSSGTKTTTQRKITPFSASAIQMVSGPEKLQASLEENFFHNNAQSTKRLIEFVGMRLASNSVKSVRGEVIEQKQVEGINELKKKCTLVLGESKNLNIIESVATKISLEAQSESLTLSTRYIRERVETLVSLLLPSPTEPAFAATCVALATKQAKSRVSQWIQTNIQPDLFVKVFQEALLKAFKDQQKTESAKQTFDVEGGCLTPCAVMSSVKKMAWSVRALGQRVDIEKVTQQLDGFLRISSNGSCHHFVPFSHLFYGLCLVQPETLVDDVIDKFTGVWPRSGSFLDHTCIKYLDECSVQGWNCVAKMFAFLLQRDRVSYKQLSSDLQELLHVMDENEVFAVIRYLQVDTKKLDGLPSSLVTRFKSLSL